MSDIKMYVWEGTRTYCGDRTGGTICSVGHTIDEAKANVTPVIRSQFEKWAKSYKEDYRETFVSEGLADLMRDFEKEPKIMKVCVVEGLSY